MPAPTIIATWPFGQTAVRVGLPRLRQGAAALDAAVAGAQAVEDDPTVHSVGYGGLPNSVGTVTLDACVMDGRTLSCGAVGCLENVRHPAAVARRILERSPHIFLVGEDARIFAVQEGFTLECLLTPESLTEWQKLHAKRGARGERRGVGRVVGEVRVHSHSNPPNGVPNAAQRRSGAGQNSPLVPHPSPLTPCQSPLIPTTR